MNTTEISTELNFNYLGAISFSTSCQRLLMSCLIVNGALLYYDFLLTLDLEISRYWGTSLSWPTLLFFLNRYLTLLGNVPAVVQRFWTAPSTPDKIKRCQQLEYYHQWFLIATQIIIGVMLFLRTYALYGQDKRILGLMAAVGACTIGACIWGTIFAGRVVDVWPGAIVPVDIGCVYEITHVQSIGLTVAWGSMAAFDCLIFFLTLYRALSRRYRTGLLLLNVLLRDGSLYFGVVLISNVSNISTFVFGGLYTRGVLTTFTNIVSSILISRLMLNIRNPALSTTANRFSESDRNEERFSTYIIPIELSTRDTDPWL
ncbi:hypothetical protein K438DRAFT_1832686 [Mycena galopus ATCC 62051]|nr:hypothetical protein K438DRAFT_1832686 [Mycena galopus ATCC 62051]